MKPYFNLIQKFRNNTKILHLMSNRVDWGAHIADIMNEIHDEMAPNDWNFSNWDLYPKKWSVKGLAEEENIIKRKFKAS